MAAIYMWPPKPGTTIVLTTTLYPVEVVDAIVFGVAVNAGSMQAISAEYLGLTNDVTAAAYVQARWFYTDGPYTDYLELTNDVISSTYVQERWFYVDGPYTENLEITNDVIQSTYVRVLVIVDTPDEKLQLSVAISPACVMEPV